MGIIKKIICSFFTLFVTYGWSQAGDVKVIPPTPEAASLGKFGSVPMSSYTGSASFSIPIYTVEGKNMSVPVNLEYNSNGVRVEDRTPWTGLGWSLSGSGIINRTVLDKADESRNFAILPDITSNELNQLNCSKLESSIYDLQYDEFTFNFMGNQGKFIVVNQKAKIIEALDDYKINIVCSTNEFAGSTTILEIVITDKNGIKYYFGKSYGSYPDPQEKAIIDGQNTPVTSWYLTKMEQWSGEIINFEYQQEIQDQYQKDFGETSKRVADGDYLCSSCPTPDGASGNFDTPIYYHVLYRPTVFHLSAIITTNSYNYDFISINRSTKTITTRNKKIRLTTTGPGADRQFLTKLEFKSLGDVLDNKYEFDYNNISAIIARNTKSKDYWGYYNGQNNDAIDKGYTKGDHKPYPQYAVYGMLTDIFYPTGGRTTIEYEGNSLVDSSNGSLQYYGGVRVKSTASVGFNQPHDDIEIKYDYNNSGEFVTPNQYSYSYTPINCDGAYTHCDKIIKNSNGFNNAYSSIEGAVFYNKVSEKQILNDGKKFEIMHYYSSAPLKTIGGAILNAPITNVNPIHFYGSAHEYKTEYYDYLYTPFVLLGETYYVEGSKRLQKREIMNYQKNFDLNGINYCSYIKEVKFTGGSTLSSATPQNGLYYSLQQLYILGEKFNLSKYRIMFFWRQLKSKTTENFFYDESNNQTSITETSDFAYTTQEISNQFRVPIHHQKIEEATSNSTSGGVISKTVTSYFYPDDLGTTPYGGGLELYQRQALNKLSRDEMHRIGSPVQTEAKLVEGNYNFNNDFITSYSNRLYTNRTTFKNFGGTTSNNLILPEFVKSFKGQLQTGEVLEDKLIYLRYTLLTSKVQEAKKDNGTIICYIYDHNKKNVIAMIENATFSQIAAQVGVSETQLENIAPIGYSPIASLENLRTTLTNAMVTTYTYNSNDKMTSVIDPKGNKTSFTYDLFGRLTTIKDNDGNVLSENEYHFKN